MTASSAAQVRGKVLVLGEDARAFLSVIRSLGRKGIEVHVAWSRGDSLALRSRYIRRVHALSAYSPSDQTWKRELIALCERERFDLVIPCNDQTLIPLQHHREELATVASFCTLSPRAFEVAFSKVETNRLARELGIRLPREMFLESIDDAPRAARELRFPLILKPEASFTQHDMASRNDVARVKDEAELRQRLGAMLARSARVIAQELFTGRGAGVEVLASGGKILFAFQHERVHEPPAGGASSYRKSVPLDPRLFDAALKLVAALEYTGVAMIEFRVNPRTADWILIEMNGRFWGSLPLCLAAGADFPHFLYEMLVLGRSEFAGVYRTDVYCRNTTQDFKWFGQNLLADKGDPTLCTVPLSDVMGEIFNLLRLREHNDTLVLDDPVPGLVEIARFFRLVFGRVRDNVALRTMSLGPVRRLHAARARRRMRDAKSILFVCHGNICRSPFAECYARKALGADSGIRIRSTGAYPKSGRTSPVGALETCGGFGINLSSHRSCVLDQEMVDEADLIFVFDQTNYRELLAKAPAARGKTFYLGALAPAGPLAIADPYGQSPDDFRECYRQIAGAIDALAAVTRRSATVTAADLGLTRSGNS